MQRLVTLLRRLGSRWLRHQAKAAFLRERSAFLEDLATSYQDGLALVDGLVSAMTACQDKGSPSSVRALTAIHRAYVSQTSGSDQPFADALRRWLPESERMILGAYERSGDLHAGLLFVAQTAEQVTTLRATLRASVSSPLITLSITAYTVWMYATDLIPVLDEMIPVEKLTTSARLLRGMSQTVQTVGPAFLVLSVIVGAVIYYQLPRWTGSWRRTFDDFMPLYRDFHGALFLLAFSALLRAGVGQAEAVAMISRQGTPWLRAHAKKVLRRLATNPTAPGEAFDTGLLSPHVTLRLRSIATSGSFHSQLQRIGLSIVAQTQRRFESGAARLGMQLELLSGAILLVLTLGFSSVTGSIQF